MVGDTAVVYTTATKKKLPTQTYDVIAVGTPLHALGAVLRGRNAGGGVTVVTCFRRLPSTLLHRRRRVPYALQYTQARTHVSTFI